MLTINVIIGKSMSGKSTVINQLKDVGVRRLVTTTTRPTREHEVNHQEYHFVNDQQKQHDLDTDQAIAPRFYHVANGDTWCYYLSYQELQDAIDHHEQNVSLILDLKGFIDLNEYLQRHPELDIQLIGWYLNVPLKERLNRYMTGNRQNEDPREVIRRFYMDEFKDFNQIDDPNFVKRYHIRIVNDNPEVTILSAIQSRKSGE